MLAGEIPLYAYGEIGGSRRVKGLGGSDSLRGFDTQRFTDDVRFFSNLEARYKVHSMWFAGQYLEWYGAGYVDTGRVWPDLADVGLGGMHVSAGGNPSFLGQRLCDSDGDGVFRRAERRIHRLRERVLIRCSTRPEAALLSVFPNRH